MNKYFKELNGVFTIAFRDVAKFTQDKVRIAFSLVFPLLFIGALGQGISQDSPVVNTTYIFTGILAQTLFQSSASGVISLIQDRENDFAQELFIAPVSRYTIIIGKIVGESMVAYTQAIGIFALGFLMGVDLSAINILMMLLVGTFICFLGGSFGVLVLSNLKEERTANQIFPILILPQLFLSGIFFGVKDLDMPLLLINRITPLTYAVDLMRAVYYENSEVTVFPLWQSFSIVVLMSTVFVVIGTYLFVKNERNR